jgi:hypothetical protein
MDKIVGFVHINKNATTCKGAMNPSEFINKTCAVMEFGVDDSVLVLNPEGTALAMFDKEDVYRGFKCGYSSGVVTPPNLDTISQMMYVLKAKQRKGGYNILVRNIVIESSLMKGEFNDKVLWSK